MSTPEQELKRLLHFGRQIPFYQPGDRLHNEFYHSCVLSTIENLLAAEKLTDAASCIVKAFSDGYSAHPAMLIYALAVCVKQQTSDRLREAAYKAVKTVCSTSENLFLFVKFATKLSPNNSIWGSGCRKIWKDWYLKKDVKSLAEIVGRQIKCHGWSHKDIIRLIHLKSDEPARAAIIKYVLFGIKAAKKEYGENSEANDVLNYLQAVEDFKHLTDEQQAARFIEIHKFTLDHVPPHLIKCKEVWAALIGNMPLTTLLNNLQRIGYYGFLKPDSVFESKVLDAFNDGDSIAESHLHPAQVYVALKNYHMSSKFVATENARKKRREEKERQTGVRIARKATKAPQPNLTILSALEKLFVYTCKLFLAPTGLRYFVAMNLENSRNSNGMCYRCPHVSPSEAGVLTSLCLLHADRNVSVKAAAANHELVPVSITTAMTVEEGVSKLDEKSGSFRMKLSTPMEWALKKKEEHDVFIVITDTVQKGNNNAVQALKKYREEMKLPNVKLVLLLLKCYFHPLWINEIDDPGVFVIGGFDGNVPRLIEAFSRGAF